MDINAGSSLCIQVLQFSRWYISPLPTSTYSLVRLAHLLGWQSNVVSGSYLSGTMVQGPAILCNSNYTPEPWQTTLIIWAVIAFAVFINIAASGIIPRFEGLILILHLVGFFAILIPLVRLGDHKPAEFVFNTFLNQGGFQTRGLSFMVWMTGNIFAFMGADAAIHVCALKRRRQF